MKFDLIDIVHFNKLFILFNLILISYSSFSQDHYLEFIEEDQKQFLQNNSWKLYYSNQGIDIYDYIIHQDRLVIAEEGDKGYIINFFDDNRLLDKQKEIKYQSKTLGLPSLFFSNGQVNFGPLQKWQCILKTDKARLKKDRVKLKKEFESFFETETLYPDLRLHSYAKYNKLQNNISYCLDIFIKDQKHHYESEQEGKVFYYDEGIDNLEFSWDPKQFNYSILDNKKGLIMFFDTDGTILNELKLGTLDKNGSQKGELHFDPITGLNYLVYGQNIYEFNWKEKKLVKLDIGLLPAFNTYFFRFYDGYIYGFLNNRDKNYKAIYRKKVH